MKLETCLNCEKEFDSELEPTTEVYDGSEESNLVGYYCHACFLELMKELG